jgi:hypothetical protein
MPTTARSPLLPDPTSLAELALVGSIFGRADSSLLPPSLGPILRRFWLASRTLQQSWLGELSRLRTELSPETERFERIALELFLTELLTRVWGTNWTIADRVRKQQDAERILGNVLQGLGRVRREVLMLMVRNWQDDPTDLISRLDRFRRRSERWTDLLIAGPASIYGTWEFAVDEDRARDFGGENWSRFGGEADPASLLISAGLRVMFGTPWPPGCCRAEPFAALASAILATLPESAFGEDGTLKPAKEWLQIGY